MLTMADVLHRLVDLAGWREESHALDAHAVIDRDLGAASSADSAAAAPTTPAAPEAKATTPADGPVK